MRVPILSPRSHIARYLETRTCASKWTFAVFCPWALVAALLMSSTHRQTMRAVFAVAPAFAAWTAHLIMIAGPALFLLLARGSLTPTAARAWAWINGLSITIGVGLIQGLSHFDLRLVGYSMAYFIINLLIPLHILALTAVTLTGLIVAAATVIATPTKDTPAMAAIAAAAPSLLFAVIGIVSSYYGRVYFMLQQRADLHLRRRNKQLHRQSRMLKRQTERVREEQQKVVDLLDRTLTAPVSEQLRLTGKFPSLVDEVVVIMCDIVAFSARAKELPGKAIVDKLHDFFRCFDDCCQRWHVEPIRSEGDNRLAITGRWFEEGASRGSDTIAAIDAIMAMIEFRRLLMDPNDARAAVDSLEHHPPLWPARIGIHVGPVMMGVMDGVRLSFDVWGDTVNVVSRLQQGAEPNTILASDLVLNVTEGVFNHETLREHTIKNTRIKAARISGLSEQFTDESGLPNERFLEMYQDLRKHR